jgi:hypothetical protein
MSDTVDAVAGTGRYATADAEVLRQGGPMRPSALYLLLLAALTGCTHHQLNRSTVLTTSTVMDIQYRIVLMNLAKLSRQPEALPDHADLSDGVVQVNDRFGFGQSGGFTSFTGSYGFGLDSFGPSGRRQVTEQWGADATTDPQRLVDLQDLYRVALGLSPLPPPNAIAYLRRQQAKTHEGLGDEKDVRSKNGSDGDKESRTRPPRDSEELPEPPEFHASLMVTTRGDSTATTGGGSTSSSGSDASGGDHRRVPIEILLSDVPVPGWYYIGGKKDVPKDACYVGCWCDRCAWVMPDGVEALSRFTVTVLNVVKLKPGEGKAKSGLAVTGDQ